MMTYETFKMAVLQHMRHFFPPHTDISIQSILKNNNTHLDGLTILEKDTHISPTIYLNSYYESYKSGKTFDFIINDIYTFYKNSKPPKDCNLDFFTDYQRLQNRIAFKVINYNKNKELLKLVPHISFLDLAIVFYCLLSTDKNGTTSILIHNRHLKHWEVEKKEFFCRAIQNTPFLLPSTLQNLTELISEYIPDSENTDFSSITQESTESSTPMYVLTNTSRLNGAGCILYPNLLSDFASQKNTDLFILPSSIHEVILLPATSYGNCPDSLSSLVKEVNGTQVSEDEILSDHVYYFSRETQKLTLCAC